MTWAGDVVEELRYRGGGSEMLSGERRPSLTHYWFLRVTGQDLTDLKKSIESNPLCHARKV